MSKALDIADDDVQVNSIKSGLSWKELLVIGGLGVAGLLGWQYLTKGSSETSTVTNIEDYEIRFFDDAGNPVKVDRLPKP